MPWKLVVIVGGKVDFAIQKLVEVVWAFPPLLLGITIMAFLGQGLFNLILALVAQRWIPYCRVVRGQQPVPVGATYADAMQVQQWMDKLVACAASR